MTKWQAIWTALSIAVVILAALTLSGCKTQPQPVVQSQEHNRVERDVVRDTIIVTTSDSAAVRALLECDSLNNVVLRELATINGQRIQPTATTRTAPNGALLLDVDCKEDSLRYEIELRDKIIEDTTRETIVVREKYVPSYYKNTSAGFWVLFVVCFVRIVWWVFKTFYLRR